jgi:hypothetical protein
MLITLKVELLFLRYLRFLINNKTDISLTSKLNSFKNKIKAILSFIKLTNQSHFKNFFFLEITILCFFKYSILNFEK